MNLKQCFLTENECYKAGVKINPVGVMVHSTGANNPTLRRYVQPDDGLLGKNTYNNDWNRPRPGGKQVCVHAFIGKLADGSVATYQTLPWNIRGWHSGYANKSATTNANKMGYIGFEICEDDLTNPEYFEKVYREAVELTAYLCKLYHLDPLKDGVVICHSEGYQRGIAYNHGDVMHWFPKHGKNMDKFRAAVAAEMEDDMTKEQVLEIIKEYEAEKVDQAPGDWSGEARTWAEQEGVIAGFGNGKMGYQTTCTREMMVVFLYRLWQKIKAYIDGKVG